MRAVVLRGGELQVRETTDPVAGPGEPLIRTVGTAICASDVHFMDHHEAVPAGGPAGMVYDPDRDIVLGHEFVGDVVAHGPGCSDVFPTGARVTAMPILLVEGRFDPLPSVGRVIGLDEVPQALEEVRRAEGPPRIVVHPYGAQRGEDTRC